MRPSERKRAIVFALFFVFSLSMMGQTLGDIAGSVTDAQGGQIAGANVTITNQSTNASRSTISNDSGLYAFPALQPGTYSLKVDKPGFKGYSRTSINVQVQETVRVDVDLSIGQVSETIEVVANAATLQTENATLGTVMDNKRIVELPLNGRNYLQLSALAPNVSYGFPTAGQSDSRQGGDRSGQNISVSGMRNNFNRFTLDGVENTDPNYNTYVILPSAEAILCARSGPWCASGFPDRSRNFVRRNHRSDWRRSRSSCARRIRSAPFAGPAECRSSRARRRCGSSPANQTSRG